MYIPLIRIHALPLALAAVCALAGRACAEDDRDHFTIGTQSYAVYVVSEGSEQIDFRASQQGNISHKPSRGLHGVVYAGMLTDGFYKKGKESQARGAYEEAADFFDQLLSGSKEWEQVYGALGEGDCLELAKKYKAAAEAFAKVVGKPDMFTTDDHTKPRHRLWLDACYREGVALAEAGDAAGAGKIADGLIAYSKLTNAVNPSGAENRAAGIQLAIATAAGDKSAFQTALVHANFRSSDEPDVWFHFNIYLAGAYLQLKQPSQALEVLQTMAGDDYLVRNPSRQAEVEVLEGSCLFASDPPGALVDLLKIDVMPFGSEDERCQARSEAGELMLGEADEAQGLEEGPRSRLPQGAGEDRAAAAGRRRLLDHAVRLQGQGQVPAR